MTAQCTYTFSSFYHSFGVRSNTRKITYIQFDSKSLVIQATLTLPLRFYKCKKNRKKINRFPNVRNVLYEHFSFISEWNKMWVNLIVMHYVNHSIAHRVHIHIRTRTPTHTAICIERETLRMKDMSNECFGYEAHGRDQPTVHCVSASLVMCMYVCVVD